MHIMFYFNQFSVFIGFKHVLAMLPQTFTKLNKKIIVMEIPVSMNHPGERNIMDSS